VAEYTRREDPLSASQPVLFDKRAASAHGDVNGPTS